MTGVYIHVPFCRSKCNYCDFYSLPPDRVGAEQYLDALGAAMQPYRGMRVDTVYFGGGNPLLLGENNLCRLLAQVRRCFDLTADAEITLETNPENVGLEGLRLLRQNGFNRISVGVQSLDDGTLRLLGRRHDAETALNALKTAKEAGFEHLSADLMLALPDQTELQVRQTVRRLVDCGIDHLSAYLLKLEPGTPFWKAPPSLPDDDAAADLYLAACDACQQNGLVQYEVSNFARPGGQSRHNLRYWELRPYLGFGPAAHSFYGGRRFYYPRSLEGFLNDPTRTVDDGEGGGLDEQLTLALRLSKGLDAVHTAGLPDVLTPRLRAWQAAGLCALDGDGLRLTPRGFLVSNHIISDILAAVEQQ